MEKEIIEKENEQNLVKYFKNEENELNGIIDEIDDLYSEIKEHYDQLKKASRSGNGGRGVLTFIEKQTSNLVSLKNSKASLINNKITMKKYEAELALKQKKDMDEKEINSDIVNAIMERLEKQEENSQIIIDEDDIDEKKNLSSEEDLLEKRLKELQKSGVIKEDEENNDGILAIGIRDKKWKFVGINEYNKVIKNFPVPDKKDYKIKLFKEDDEIKAVDQDNRIYKVIKLKSKKK